MSNHELSIEERITIQLGLVQGFSQRRIARSINRAPSTVSRELRRYREVCSRYSVRTAQQRMQVRRRRCRPKRKLLSGSERFELVAYMLREGLSPEQIAGELPSMNIPSFKEAYLCCETIYTAIYALPVCELSKELIICLRQGEDRALVEWIGAAKSPRWSAFTCPPTEIEDRLMPGYWGGDLIKGKANASSVGTLVERACGYVMLVRMNDANCDLCDGGLQRSA